MDWKRFMKRNKRKLRPPSKRPVLKEPEPPQKPQPQAEADAETGSAALQHQLAAPAPFVVGPASALPQPLPGSSFSELLLYSRATEYLWKCIRWTRTRHEEPDFWNSNHNGGIPAMFDECWNWLTGVWQSRGIMPPSEDQMLAWAKEPVKR